MDVTLTVGDSMSVRTSVGGSRAVLSLAHGSDTVDLAALDPDVWRRLESACRALYLDHMAALSPPPRREMIP